jgi:Flp pilus assembly protein TadD
MSANTPSTSPSGSARPPLPLSRAALLVVAALAAVALGATQAAAQGTRAPIGGLGGEHTLYGEFRVDESKVEKREAGAAQVPQSFTLVLYNEQNKIIDRRAAMNNSSFRFQGLRNGIYELSVEAGGLSLTRVRFQLDGPRGIEFRQDISLAWDAAGGAGEKKPVVSAAEYYERPAATRDTFERAAAAARKKKFKDAAPLLRQVVETDPKDHLAWAHLGSAYSALGQNPEAERAYEQALALKPELTAAAVNLGRLYVLGKSYAKAVEVLKGAVEKMPDSADAQHLLGEAYLQTGRLAEATAHFREALRLDPKGKAEVHLRLAAVQDATGSKAEAAAELELFIAKRPDHPNRPQFEQYVRANKKR